MKRCASDVRVVGALADELSAGGNWKPRQREVELIPRGNTPGAVGRFNALGWIEIIGTAKTVVEIGPCDLPAINRAACRDHTGRADIL